MAHPAGEPTSYVELGPSMSWAVHDDDGRAPAASAPMAASRSGSTHLAPLFGVYQPYATHEPKPALGATGHQQQQQQQPQPPQLPPQLQPSFQLHPQQLYAVAPTHTPQGSTLYVYAPGSLPGPQQHPQQVVFMPSSPPAPTRVPGYGKLEARYRQLDRAIVGLSVAQMVLWFPLGFLYFVGMLPRRRGRLHMGMGIMFFGVAMIAFISILAVTYNSCVWYDSFGGGTTGTTDGTTGTTDATSGSFGCYDDPTMKLAAFFFLPYIALAAASIGVGARHHNLEVLLRLLHRDQFAVDFPSRAGSPHPALS